MKLEVFLSSDELSRHLRDLIPRLKKAKHKVKVHNVFGPFDAMKALSLGIKNYPAVYVKDTGEIKQGNDALLFVLSLLGVKVSASPIEEELRRKVEAGEVEVAREEAVQIQVVGAAVEGGGAAALQVAEPPRMGVAERAPERVPLPSRAPSTPPMPGIPAGREEPREEKVVIIKRRQKPEKKGFFGKLSKKEEEEKPLIVSSRDPEYYKAVADALLSDGAYAGFASAATLDELEKKLNIRKEEGIVVLDVQVKMGKDWVKGVLVYEDGVLAYASLEGFEARSPQDIIKVIREQAKRITAMVYKRK